MHGIISCIIGDFAVYKYNVGPKPSVFNDTPLNKSLGWIEKNNICEYVSYTYYFWHSNLATSQLGRSDGQE